MGVDGEVLRWMHAHASPTGLAFFAFVSRLGSPTAMTLLALVTSVVLVRRRELRLASGYLMAVAGGGLLNRLLKLWVHRARPDGALDLLAAPSFSFPSGHTMGTTIGLGMLYFVIVSVVSPSRSARRWTAAAMVLFALLVAFSRVYLGAHYLTDVIGGLAFGALWVALSTWLLQRDRRATTPAARAP
jgi:undecaprenyl-diphosphatase